MEKDAICEFCGNKFEYDHADLLFEPKNLGEMKKKYGDSFPPLSEYKKIGVAYCSHCKKLNIVWRESWNG